MSDPTADRLAIRDLVENWAVWRDAGDWERFRTVWHPDGRMMATWFQGPAEDFIRVSQEGFARGVRILHFLGGTSIDLAGDRAIAQTKMTISQRGLVEDVLCEWCARGASTISWSATTSAGGSCCASRSTRRTGWIRSTRPPGSSCSPATLARFPEGYRHLAYLQAGMGYDVKADMPGLAGPEVDALYRRGARWLAGAERLTASPRLPVDYPSCPSTTPCD